MNDNELKKLFEGMDIPNLRRDVSKVENLRWLQRNILIRNAKTDNAIAALAEISRRLMENRLSMKSYSFIITLVDTGLPYPDLESATNDAKEWADEIAVGENCMVAKVEVQEETDDES